MDLFEYAKSKTLDQESPLASRLRPTTLDEVVGQQHIIGKNTLLYRAIKADKLTSVIFYGPPGTGKTTLAKVIANTTSAEFTQINATVRWAKKTWRQVVARSPAGYPRVCTGKKTILFVDEIHRFNKGQQDYLPPIRRRRNASSSSVPQQRIHTSKSTAALISRSIIFELKSLADLRSGRASSFAQSTTKQQGMGNYKARY